MLRGRRVVGIVVAAVAVGAGLLAAVAIAKMTSTKLEPRLCETRGGGRFVDIPGFPGEQIDRRLLRDIRFLVRRYHIFATDGFSTSDVHARNGEHPIGLALDIVPDDSKRKRKGKRWRKINRLAKWAEPRQNRPRPPFRWVGYNGDPGHGRGHHLHLSWSHSDTRPEDPARTVYTIKCPDGAEKVPELEPDPEESGGIGARIRALQRSAVPERR